MQNEERINVLEGKVKKLEELVHTLKTKLPPAVVRAESFIVEDLEGNELVQLYAEDGRGVVKTMNYEGQTLVILNSTTGGRGMVKTMNGEGQAIVKITANIDGEGVIFTTNGEGQELVALNTNTDGEGIVTTMDGKGQELAELSVSN